MIQTKVVEENKKHILRSTTVLKIRAVYNIMWKHFV